MSTWQLDNAGKGGWMDVKLKIEIAVIGLQDARRRRQRIRSVCICIRNYHPNKKSYCKFDVTWHNLELTFMKGVIHIVWCLKYCIISRCINLTTRLRYLLSWIYPEMIFIYFLKIFCQYTNVLVITIGL